MKGVSRIQFFTRILKAKHNPGALQRLEKEDVKSISAGIENVFLEIMSMKIEKSITGPMVYSIVPNLEEPIYICWVDESLQGHEELIEFYPLSEHDVEIVHNIFNDVLLKLHLIVNNWKGQCFYGGSNNYGL